MKRKTAATRKSKATWIRLTATEHLTLKTLARIAGKPISELIRDMIADDAEFKNTLRRQKELAALLRSRK